MNSFFSQLQFWSVLSLLFLLAIPVTPLPTAAPAVKRDTALDAVLKTATSFINSIQTAILEQVDDILTLPTGKYAITQNSKAPILRATGVAVKKTTFNYGPPVAGGPYFPTGALGTTRVLLDQAFIQEDLVPELALAVADAAAATVALPQVCRINRM